MKRHYIRYFLLLLFLPAFHACEKVTEDIPAVVVDAENNGASKVFYTLQEQDIAIEPAQFISLLNAKSLKITSNTAFGTAVFIDEGALLYTPQEGIVEADEQIKVELLKNDGKVITENILIKILPKDSKMPCFLGAVSDRMRVEMNRKVTLDVLANDQFCEGKFASIKLLTTPKNGTALIENEKVVYTPNQNYKGLDRFFYRIEIEKPDKQIVKRIASVNFEVFENKPTCQTRLIKDNYVLKPQSLKDSFFLNVLSNDIICPEDQNGPIQLKLLSKPFLGVAQVISNKFISFRFTVSPLLFNQTPRDSFIYQISAKSGIYTSKVLLLNPKPGSDCNIVVIADDIIVPLKEVQNRTFIEVDPLRNDFLCSTSTRITKVTPISPAAANLIVLLNNQVKYSPAGGKFVREEVRFQYEVTDDKGKKATAVVRIKFVD
ncbi:MAG: Ig-like domain-containing protein [Saprospiraceae bacterium]